MLSIGELPEDIIITEYIMMMLAAILWSQPYYDDVSCNLWLWSLHKKWWIFSEN